MAKVSLPKKLKKDAIVEALLEIRFDSTDSNELPELLVARLAGMPKWADFAKVRLSIADVPPSVRAQNPAFKFQPVLELKGEKQTRIVKIGENVISYHALAPYPSWEVLRVELSELVDWLFSACAHVRVERLGFRYLNVLNSVDHNVSSVSDLTCTLQFGADKFSGPQNINYRRDVGGGHTVLVRIASPEFVSGPTLGTLNAFIDIDVFTPQGWTSADKADMLHWIEEAHTAEKTEFFKLIPAEVLSALVEG